MDLVSNEEPGAMIIIDCGFTTVDPSQVAACEFGAIAQLGERGFCTAQVSGSIPDGSTILLPPLDGSGLKPRRRFSEPWREFGRVEKSGYSRHLGTVVVARAARGFKSHLFRLSPTYLQVGLFCLGFGGHCLRSQGISMPVRPEEMGRPTLDGVLEIVEKIDMALSEKEFRYQFSLTVGSEIEISKFAERYISRLYQRAGWQYCRVNQNTSYGPGSHRYTVYFKGSISAEGVEHGGSKVDT